MNSVAQQLVAFTLQPAGYEGLSQDILDQLYDRFIHEMPYGTAKARTGDPYEWLENKIANMIEHASKGTTFELACEAVAATLASPERARANTIHVATSQRRYVL